VGSEGLEPSPTWLRARHAAASTLIPLCCFCCFVDCAQSARRESNPRPDAYKRPALTTELRAAAIAGPSQLSGAEGSRTLTFPLKRRKRCRYATTPSVEWAYAFDSRASCQRRFSVLSPLSSVVVLRIELSHLVISRVWATSPQLPSRKSGRSESNRLSRAPKAREAPSLFHPMVFVLSVARVGIEPTSPP
jgi:hypothetical protein